MLFETESGSTYEIDVEGKCIRRLIGRLQATTRQGSDGVWKKIKGISDIVPGHRVLIEWENEQPFTPDSGDSPCTLTNVVKAVWEKAQAN